MIQQLFSEKLSLKNDKAKVGGFDSSNDGNTARRAFNAPEIFAEITGSMPQLNKKLKNHSYIYVCRANWPSTSPNFKTFAMLRQKM